MQSPPNVDDAVSVFIAPEPSSEKNKIADDGDVAQSSPTPIAVPTATTGVFVATVENTTVLSQPTESGVRCLRHKIFTKFFFHPLLLAILACMCWGLGLWISGLPSTGLTSLELACTMFTGEAIASILGTAFGVVK